MPKQAFTPTVDYQQRYSDIVLGYVMGSDIGHAFREVTLTKEDGMILGSILAEDLTVAADATAADTVFVWTDAGAFGLANIATGQKFRAVIAKRDVTLNRYLLVYKDGSAIDDAGVDALEDLGLKVTDKVLLPTT